ncbi:prepilin-type N-terminal cleavage/methylation domain-containing protein [Verrucomicrobiales bacterium]|jgi:uncharacterized protein (TIGR02598 family)|nr:prepilin-type N-terminal cleavage/methylation domain-containing protein [Verrucomicrobiales bacterium]MDB4662643.1 prepilin-type N-terminal cleavage/methylation domain-containing protein [Verrucomicrobiales bacterium]
MKTNRNAPAARAFSLIEVTIAMAIAAVALILIVGLLPPALTSARDSADQTAIGTVLEDVHDRLEGSPLKVGVPDISPLFYDQQGRFVSDDHTDTLESRRFFKVELELAEFSEAAKIENINGMLGLSVEVYWPLNESRDPIGSSRPKTTISYPVTTFTGPDWQLIEPEFVPKIEF